MEVKLPRKLSFGGQCKAWCISSLWLLEPTTTNSGVSNDRWWFSHRPEARVWRQGVGGTAFPTEALGESLDFALSGFRRLLALLDWSSIAWGTSWKPESSLIPDSQNMEWGPKTWADISAQKADGTYRVQASSPRTLISQLQARTRGSKLPQIPADPDAGGWWTTPRNRHPGNGGNKDTHKPKDQRHAGSWLNPQPRAQYCQGFPLLLDSKNRNWCNPLRNNAL